MYVIGLTGLIASGKSQLAGFMQAEGAAYISADQLARAVCEPGEIAYAAILAHFGEAILAADSRIDRQALRSLIFAEPKERLWLENLLHPKIRQTMAEAVSQAQGPYCLVEIPLLRNRSDYPYLDRVLLVKTDTSLQIERLITRDKHCRTLAESILKSQANLSEFYGMADDIVFNHEDLQSLSLLAGILHRKYLREAREKFS